MATINCPIWEAFSVSLYYQLIPWWRRHGDPRGVTLSPYEGAKMKASAFHLWEIPQAPSLNKDMI